MSRRESAFQPECLQTIACQHITTVTQHIATTWLRPTVACEHKPTAWQHPATTDWHTHQSHIATTRQFIIFMFPGTDRYHHDQLGCRKYIPQGLAVRSPSATTRGKATCTSIYDFKRGFFATTMCKLIRVFALYIIKYH